MLLLPFSGQKFEDCPKDGGSTLLRNVGKFIPKNTASHPTELLFRVTALRTSEKKKYLARLKNCTRNILYHDSM
jgi:hypothetical protein